MNEEIFTWVENKTIKKMKRHKDGFRLFFTDGTELIVTSTETTIAGELQEIIISPPTMQNVKSDNNNFLEIS